MNGFESFRVDAWLEDGLTRHVKAVVSGRAGRQQRASWKTKIVASAFATAAVASLFLRETAAQMEFPWSTIASIPAHAAGADIVSVAPEVFWAEMIAEIAAWKQLNVQQLADPPVLF